MLPRTYLDWIMNKYHILNLILAEICLKRIILETNFQISPSAGGSPLQATLNLQFW